MLLHIAKTFLLPSAHFFEKITYISSSACMSMCRIGELKTFKWWHIDDRKVKTQRQEKEFIVLFCQSMARLGKDKFSASLMPQNCFLIGNEPAKRAEKVQFHPSQKISLGRNGSLMIELRCRGHRELIWELLHSDWIGHVKMESPEGLQKEYLGQLDRAKLAV